jgi:hypothetical protein
MQKKLTRDDLSYRPIRVSHHRKVPLHFQEEADKTLKWFLDSGLIVPVPPTENVAYVSPGFSVAKPTKLYTNLWGHVVTSYRALTLSLPRSINHSSKVGLCIKTFLTYARPTGTMEALERELLAHWHPHSLVSKVTKAGKIYFVLEERANHDISLSRQRAEADRKKRHAADIFISVSMYP